MPDYVALETTGHLLLEDGVSGLLVENPYSSYSFTSDESITRTFNAYSPSGDTRPDRYKGATPTDLARKVWTYTPYQGTAVAVAEGGGISIYGARQEITPEIAWEDV
jgi:hypothetical protein